VDLSPATAGGVTVDGCGKCGGVWFDNQELTRMSRGDLTHLAALDRTFGKSGEATPATETLGSCPECGTALVWFEPPQAQGLRLIRCDAGHGIWLREEDFEAVIGRVEQWRVQRAKGPGPAVPAPSSPATARQRVREVARGLLMRACPRCRQPNAADSGACWACGAVLAQAPSLFSCPRCFDPMDPILHQGITLNQCRVCGNLWLDRGELGALIKLPTSSLTELSTLPPAELHAPVAPPTFPCPACNGELREHEYAANSGLRIHSCGGCRGVWLDPTLLLKIQQFVEANERFLPSTGE
jgi:Zn-finger nucleic acid-binding protein